MPSFGEELRRERELRRITLREVADATKINLRYLEALDRNDFEHLPGGVFNRGFVRAYAQYIGVDADQMVSAYMLELRAQSGNDAGAEASDPLMRGPRSSATLAASGSRDSAAADESGRLPWVKVGLAVLLAAVVIASCVFLYQRFVSGSSGRGEAGARQPTGTASLPAAHDRAAALPAKQPPAKQPPADPAGAAPAETPEPTDSADAPPAAPVEAGGAPTEPAPPAGAMLATIHVDRATTGRVNCDNSRIELLDGMPPGSRLELACSAFLVVDADDGGALRIGWPGVAPVAAGPAGVPLLNHRIDPPATAADSGRHP